MIKKAGDIKKVLYPVIKLKPYVKSIWLNNNKISILVDDTIETDNDKKSLQKAIKKCTPIFPFTKNKSLSLWWELVRNSEPKTLKELNNLTVVYDEAGYITLFKKMLEQDKLFPANKKADILLQSAKNSLVNTEEILLKDISREIFKGMTETAQALLLYFGHFSSDPEEILKTLENLSKKRGIDGSFLKAYKEIVEEIKGIDKGEIDEFTAKDAGYYLSLAKYFMFGMEDLIASFERDRSDNVMRKAYLFCLELCKESLRSKMNLVPLRDDEKLKFFRENYVDTGEIDYLHYQTLEALHRYHVSDRKEKLNLMNDKALDRSRINNLSLVMQSLLGE